MGDAYEIGARIKKALYLTPKQREKTDLQQKMYLKDNKDRIFEILYYRMVALGLTDLFTFDQLYRSFSSIGHADFIGMTYMFVINLLVTVQWSVANTRSVDNAMIKCYIT